MDWLSAVIPVALFEYALVIVIFRYYDKCKCQSSSCCQCSPAVESEDADAPVDQVESSNLGVGVNDAVPVSSVPHPTARSMQFQLRFENTYKSTLRCDYVLLTTRILSFLYIGGATIFYLGAGDPTGLFYFTLWNTILISLFFLCAVVCSVVGIAYPTSAVNDTSNDGNNVVNSEEGFGRHIETDMEVDDGARRMQFGWSPCVLRWIQFVQVLFEVCGGTAAFVTVVAFSFLDSSFTFANATLHFVTIVTMLVELSLNTLYVRFDHFPLNLGWAMVYLIFTWPIVETGAKSSWPYDFLDTSTHLSPVWYTVLLLANFIFYMVFYALSELKFLLVTNPEWYHGCHSVFLSCAGGMCCPANYPNNER